jgi:hypothetical protein
VTSWGLLIIYFFWVRVNALFLFGHKEGKKATDAKVAIWKTRSGESVPERENDITNVLMISSLSTTRWLDIRK